MIIFFIIIYIILIYLLNIIVLCEIKTIEYIYKLTKKIMKTTPYINLILLVQIFLNTDLTIPIWDNINNLITWLQK